MTRGRREATRSFIAREVVVRELGEAATRVERAEARVAELEKALIDALVEAARFAGEAVTLEAELENTRRQRDQNARLFKDFEGHHARQLAERDGRVAALEAALETIRMGTSPGVETEAEAQDNPVLTRMVVHEVALRALLGAAK